MNNIGKKVLRFLKKVPNTPAKRAIGRAIQIHSTSRTTKTIAQTGNLSFFFGCEGGVVT